MHIMARSRRFINALWRSPYPGICHSSLLTKLKAARRTTIIMGASSTRQLKSTAMPGVRALLCIGISLQLDLEQYNDPFGRLQHPS